MTTVDKLEQARDALDSAHTLWFNATTLKELLEADAKIVFAEKQITIALEEYNK